MNEAPPMTCRELVDFLMAYLDGELPPEKRREFDRHLAICSACVAYLQTYQQTVRLGKAALAADASPAAGKVPEGLLRAIRAARAASTN